MPDAPHLEKCSHCGLRFITTSFTDICCGRCKRTGHTVETQNCPICVRGLAPKRDPLDTLENIISIQGKRKGRG